MQMFYVNGGERKQSSNIEKCGETLQFNDCSKF